MVGRLSRFRKKRVAFVLSGGGPMGAVQVGFLRALFENGITPDFVVGCSVGAFNAVQVASDPSLGGVEDLEEIWKQMRKDDLFPGGRLTSAWHALRKGSHVFTNRGLRRIIEESLGPRKRFEELELPAFVVATRLSDGAEVWFSTGRVEGPLLATAAMPGVFPPVTVDGVQYVDGGIVNNIPVMKAVEKGARKIYILNVSGSIHPRELHRPHDFMMHGLVLSRAHRYQSDTVRAADSAELIEFPKVDFPGVAFTNLANTSELIEAGYETATRSLRAYEEPSSKAPAV